VRRQPAPPALSASLVRRAVVVTLADDSGARGVLMAADDSGLLLGPAPAEPVAYCPPGAAEWQDAEGQLFVPAASIKFVQLPGGT
jgi:hypothetical protein